MKVITRRDFLKISGVAAVGLTISQLGFDLTPVQAYAAELRIKGAKETPTICCFCSVGCGILVSTDKKGKVINAEGDPDHPISEGALCAKGASSYQIAVNDNRLKKVRYRAPNSDKWKEVSWEWAMDKIATNIKKSRDKSFMEKNADGKVVNRTNGIASVGSAAMDNEECWLYQKMLRALGLVYIEHQARICHSPSVPALAESFGRGAMTNHYIDFRNADVILNMGGDVAEKHPVSFKWIQAARNKGATFIHVDPRFTRTSSKADIYARLRPGTDIAFLGGMIKYILDNNLYDEFYVRNYTNASFIVNPKYGFDDGLFSGYDPNKRAYDKSTWALEKDEAGIPKRDMTLQNERCVFQLLKKHYSRYTMEKVTSITGTPQEDLEKVYKTYSSTGKPDKAGTELYAMGWTQHTVGTQNIRAMSIIQTLLGNMGIAGGGINALRGESNVQGSTDQGLLFHIVPGYLPTPRAQWAKLADYNKTTPSTKDPRSVNWWKNRPNYVASLLKSFYGEKATKENDFGYALLPKLDPTQDASWLNLFDEMYKGTFTGFFAWGMNPACSSANAGKVRTALAKLDWMVNVNVFDSETGSFWKGPGMDPTKIKTEVFQLPCAAFLEKEGSITNSGRWMQWRWKTTNPPGDAMPDGEIMNDLFKKVQALYKKEKGVFPDPILNLKWDYETNGKFDIHTVAKEINGYFLEDIPEHPVDKKSYKKGTLVPSFVFLLDDGRTSCGNWIYSASYTEAGNMAARRKKTDPTGLGLYPEWSWAWPVNRRIIYNRASVDLEGKPRNPNKALLKWDAEAKKWAGDVPDGPAPPMGTEGVFPFIMKPDGVASLFGPGLADGPFPEHYEPLECPIEKNLMSNQRINPAIKIFEGGPDTFATCNPKYPFVCSTYRVAEHWQTGVLTRWLPWLIEAQPQLFCEMSQELAKLREISNGDRVLVETSRGKVEAVAMVTLRLKPLVIVGKTVHMIGLPYHYGWLYPKDGGDSANLLTPTVGDANTMMPEYKAFMANVTKITKQPTKKVKKA